MKAFVITIMDNPKSVEMSNRCIESCKRYGLHVEPWAAITPRNPQFESLVEMRGIDPDMFESKWSRRDNAIACFLSMASLWDHAVACDQPVLILEHDAVMTGRIPDDFDWGWVCTLGKPSYGKYNTPTKIGTGRLVQKPYFGGAHAYVVSPEGARRLLEKVPTHACPTDVYLNVENFGFLEEHYPWCFRVNDSFSTIQQETGCLAKHNYEKGIELVEP